VSLPRPSTARAHLVSVLTGEILQHPDPGPFPIASEHQLCRRFQISRVTVRLALGDLENRGLIYRRHGKGTFAHGRAHQIHRDIGILMKLPQSEEHRPIAEMIRGAQSVMAGLRSAVVLLSLPPEAWRPDLAGRLGGVIVIPQEVTEGDLQVLRDRNVPFLLGFQSPLSGPRIDLGQRKAACARTEELLRRGHRQLALLSGYDASLDAAKREGVHDALRAAGIDPASVPEFSTGGEENAIQQAARDLLRSTPRPTAVIAFDDSLGSLLSFVARRQEGLRVPDDLSIVSFHDWPYLHYVEPTLSTVRFEFFTAGQQAAQALNLAALTGNPVPDLRFEPTYQPGQTVGPAPVV
jgi:DNA-binding LacI/PurR family transcriptional regulator